MGKAAGVVVNPPKPKDKAKTEHGVVYDIAVMFLNFVGILDSLIISLLVVIGFGHDVVSMRTDLFKPDPRQRTPPPPRRDPVAARS
jgi:hypothetical protein